jgi:hypothetical protein
MLRLSSCTLVWVSGAECSDQVVTNKSVMFFAYIAIMSGASRSGVAGSQKINNPCPPDSRDLNRLKLHKFKMLYAIDRYTEVESFV